MIDNFFKVFGLFGLITMIYYVCKYIQAKGDTKKADELMMQDIKNVADNAGYILANDKNIEDCVEEELLKKTTKKVANFAIEYIILRILAAILAIVFVGWLFYLIAKGLFSPLPG